MTAIFVYGLLKPDYSLHHVVAPFVDRSTEGSARGRLYDAGVPAARFDEDGTIEGFVLWLRRKDVDDALRVLDDVEDEGEVYRRIEVVVQTSEGPVRAQAYEFIRSPDGHRYVGASWPR